MFQRRKSPKGSFSSEYYNVCDWTSLGQNLRWNPVLHDHEIANEWDKKTTGVYKSEADRWYQYQTSVNAPKTREAVQFHKVRSNATYSEFTQGPASFFIGETRA